MRQPLRRSRLVVANWALGWLLAVPAVPGQEMPATRICDVFEARIHRLPVEVRRRADGEGGDAWRRRLIRELEVEAALAAEAQALRLDEAPDWRSSFDRRRAALLMRALEDSFGAGISVEPAEIERRFDENRERFRRPEKISTSFILLELPPDATVAAVEEARSRLLEIRAEHAAGERFGALARRYSAAENAARGGAVAASPRGALLAEYEAVAWSLAPGDVSEPFRLPDGMAIVRLEHVFEAAELGLDEARRGVEKRLVWEKTQARRNAALAEARARWPATVVWPDGAAGPSEIRLDGEALGLEELGLASRPPRLRARVAEELDRRQLVRLAEDRGFAGRAPTAEALAALRESMLAAAAVELRLESLVREPAEADLRALYDADPRRFPDPERRAFEVHFLPGAEGALRAVREEAERRAARWREGSPPAALETWGPLARSEIGASTSPLLAGIAFALSAGEVSEPVRLERYRPETARFATEGYVVLRLVDVRPASTLPFDAVRHRLASSVVGEERERANLAVRAELAAGLDVEAALERLESCDISAAERRRPSPARQSQP